jgi:hypothetical protein
VSHEILDGSNVDAAFEQMGGKRMEHSVAGGAFWVSRPSHGVFELALHGMLWQVMPGEITRSRIGQTLAAEKTYCHRHSLEVFGYLRRSESFRWVSPRPSARAAAPAAMGRVAEAESEQEAARK